MAGSSPWDDGFAGEFLPASRSESRHPVQTNRDKPKANHRCTCMPHPWAQRGGRMFISDAEVRQWLQGAEPGQALQYFRGFLARAVDGRHQLLRDAERQEVARVADRLWRAAHHKRVHLVQLRHGPEDFTYIAIARERRRCS